MATATTQPDVTSGTVSAAQIAKEVQQQGGSTAQAWVAAALASGIESGGQLNDKNPTSTACGLFQFLTTTWASNGGTKYAPTACQASLAQQVAVFLTASSGNNFRPWAPDLGGSYSNSNPVTSPAPGSAVANKISDLSASGALSFLGNVPTNWADAGAATAANPAPGPLGAAAGLVTGGTSVPNIPNPITGVDSFFAALGNGFGLGWSGILTIGLGIALLIIGLIFMFHKQAVQIGTAAAMA